MCVHVSVHARVCLLSRGRAGGIDYAGAFASVYTHIMYIPHDESDKSVMEDVLGLQCVCVRVCDAGREDSMRYKHTPLPSIDPGSDPHCLALHVFIQLAYVLFGCKTCLPRLSARELWLSTLVCAPGSPYLPNWYDLLKNYFRQPLRITS